MIRKVMQLLFGYTTRGAVWFSKTRAYQVTKVWVRDNAPALAYRATRSGARMMMSRNQAHRFIRMVNGFLAARGFFFDKTEGYLRAGIKGKLTLVTVFAFFTEGVAVVLTNRSIIFAGVISGVGAMIEAVLANDDDIVDNPASGMGPAAPPREKADAALKHAEDVQAYKDVLAGLQPAMLDIIKGLVANPAQAEELFSGIRQEAAVIYNVWEREDAITQHEMTYKDNDGIRRQSEDYQGPEGRTIKEIILRNAAAFIEQREPGRTGIQGWVINKVTKQLQRYQDVKGTPGVPERNDEGPDPETGRKAGLQTVMDTRDAFIVFGERTKQILGSSGTINEKTKRASAMLEKWSMDDTHVPPTEDEKRKRLYFARKAELRAAVAAWKEEQRAQKKE